MRRARTQIRKEVVRLFARQFQVKRVRAQVEFTGPFQRSKFRDSNPLENSVALPSLKHAAPGNVAKIDNARKAVVEAEKQFVFLERFGLGDLHGQSLHQTLSAQKHAHGFLSQKSHVALQL
jgi:hypothetical protein